MIFEVQDYSLIFHDAIFSMGAGFLAGVFYQFLGAFLYSGRVQLFIKDVLAGIVFTTLIFSYSISFANYPILRWYMVLCGVLGMVVFPICFSKWCNILVRLAAVTATVLSAAAYKKVCGKLLAIWQKNKEKKQKITQKNQPETLKNDDILLYN